jgi:hypothetical protein
MSPRRLAEFAIARPRRVLAVWGVIVVAGVVLTGAFLGTALTPEGDFTGNPESKQARELIEERLPERDAVDEVVIVRSEERETTASAFRERIRSLAEELRRSGSVEEISTCLDPGGEALVSEDQRATILPLALAEEEDESIEEVVEIVQRADGTDGFVVEITGLYTAGRDFERIAGEDLAARQADRGLGRKRGTQVASTPQAVGL